jgi:hypothetical protein
MERSSPVKSLTCIVVAGLLAVTAHARTQVVRRNPEHERRIEIVPDLADRDSRMTLPTQSKRLLERSARRGLIPSRSLLRSKFSPTGPTHM